MNPNSSGSNPQHFSKNPRMMGMYNSVSGTQKNITIKKILHDLEKDLGKAEEENYQMIKEQAEIRMIKNNPKLAKTLEIQRELKLQ